MPEHGARPGSAPKRILVADDDPAIVEVLQLMLEEDGYAVATTTDGAVVARLGADPAGAGLPDAGLPDLILLDVWMSGYDGRDLCRQLKRRAATRRLPIILVSANRDTPRLARECGADGYLAKPFEMDDLLALVARHLTDKA